MFCPSLFGVFFNPFYIIRKGLFKNILNYRNYLSGTMLDFGCGKRPYKHLFNVQNYIGVDLDESGHDHKNEHIDVYYDGKKIPFDNDHFDSVFSSEVFEHIFNLGEILDELYRVTKPGGHMLITLPFVWDEHEIPYDFARYTSFGIEHLLTKAGFKIIHSTKTTNYVETIFQMWNAYVNQHILPSNQILKILFNPVLIAPITILGIALAKILPKNDKFYHNNVIVCRK